MTNDRARLGDWNVICHRCGRKVKASRIRKEPKTGFFVCLDHGGEVDPWHPLELGPRTPREQIATPWTRSQQNLEDSDFGPSPPTPDTPGCNIYTVQSIAGIAVAGCWIAGLDSNLPRVELLGSSDIDPIGIPEGTFTAGDADNTVVTPA